MEFDRETAHQLLLAGSAVGVFIAAAVYVGTTYTTNGALSTDGGLVLVGILGLFILLMLGAGLVLERREY